MATHDLSRPSSPPSSPLGHRCSKATRVAELDGPNTFRHEAFFSSRRDDFTAVTASLIRDALAADEPVFVVVAPEKIHLLRVWREGETLICQIQDRGHIRDPLAGRRLPVAQQESGWGLWLANHLCDLVQVRSSPEGTIVRLHTART